MDQAAEWQMDSGEESMKLVLHNQKTDEIRIVEAGELMPFALPNASSDDLYWNVVEGYQAYQLGRQQKAQEILEALARESFGEKKP